MEIVLIGDTEADAALEAYPKRATTAIVRAINRALGSGRTAMVKAIAADTGLKSGVVREAFKIREATFGNPEGRLATSLKRIPLIDFNAKATRRGVSYRLRGGRGRHPNAFIRRMTSGHEGVFVRTGRARLPIRELFGPSLGHVFAKYRPAGIARMREAFATNFAHEMGWAKAQDAGAD
jgi:hypothetical protein